MKTKWVRMPRQQMRRYAIKCVLKSLGDLKGKKILEMGYGSGDIFSLYQKFGLDIYGYDFSDMAYEFVSSIYGDEVHLLRNEMEVAANGKYDIVCAFEVLEHIEDDDSALKHWCELIINENMDGGGYLLLSVPAHQSRWDANDVTSGHFRRYEKYVLKEKLKSAGFSIQRIWTYDWPSCFLLDTLRAKHRSKKFDVESLKYDDKIDLTKGSGVLMDYNKLQMFFANPVLWSPIIRLQRLFFNTDWGSAFIVLAQKNI